MNNLMEIKNTIKSTELVEIINSFRKEEGSNTELQHKDFMKKIRKEVETLKNLGLEGQGNFSQSSYINLQGKEQPCFELNRDGMLEMLNSESAYVRYKTIEYINKLEEQIKQPKPACIEDVLIQSLQEMKDVKYKLAEVQQESKDTKQEVQNMREVITLNPNQWRKDTANMINKMAAALGGFEHIKPIREESYKMLNEKLGVCLKTRVLNKKKKMALEGVPKYKIDKINPLDAIADDKKLINGYVNIIKELAIKYKVA